MFFWNNDKAKLKHLEAGLNFLSDEVEELRKRIRILEEAAYGLKKDGTPRAKPGRKTK